MSELREFVKKRLEKYSGVSSRKLYGLDAFYLRNTPFIVISSNQQIVVKVVDFEVKKTLLKIPDVNQWSLNEKEMENWFVLPESFNKKKNKLSPILDMSAEVLLNPKKEKKKTRKKPKIQKRSDQVKPIDSKPIEKKSSFLKRLFKS